MDGLQYPVTGTTSAAWRRTGRISTPLAWCHRGSARLGLEIPIGGTWLQAALSGSMTVQLGHRSVTMNSDHFHIGMQGIRGSGSRDSADLISVVIPFNRVSARRSLSRHLADHDSIDRLRFRMDGELRRELQRFKRFLPIGRSVPMTDPDGIEPLLQALDANLGMELEGLERLPGRSMFKRVDLFMRLEAARDHIETHFADDPPTPKLAEISHISRAHFIRVFSSFYGISPKQMTLARKLEEAKRLMRETEFTVSEVARHSGFGNRCAFQRLFRSRVECTPLQYRRRYRRLVDDSLKGIDSRRHGTDAPNRGERAEIQR